MASMIDIEKTSGFAAPYHAQTTIMEKQMPSTIVEKEVPPSAETTERKQSVVRYAASSAAENAELGDSLTPAGRFLFRLLDNRFVRYCIYVLPVCSILAIPLALFATKFRSSTADGISLLGLFIYIECAWVSLWVAKLAAWMIPYVFQGICGIISTGVRKYALLFKAVEIPFSMFLWAIAGYALIPVIYTLPEDTTVWNKRHGNIAWIHSLTRCTQAGIISSAMFLIEKTLMQLIAVSYHGKQHQKKIHDIRNTTNAIDQLYSASLRRFPEYHPAVEEEDYDIHDTTNVQRMLKTYSLDRSVRRAFGDLHHFGEQLVSVFGRVASDVAGVELLQPSEKHAVVEAALERKAGAAALARRIFKSLVKPGADCIYEEDIAAVLKGGSEDQAEIILAQLDKDGNGNVTQDEMVMLCVQTQVTKKDMWKSANNIKDAIKVLDRVISFFLLLLVALIFAAFFSTFVANNYKQIFSILSASAFSFSQTVGEFNAACILVFIKHPFDVGDRVNINNIEYEVVRISLLYTVFRRIDNETIVQAANSTLGGLWVDNITRSNAMKEVLSFKVNSKTGFSDIERLRVELQNFVIAPENSRDYQKDVEIQLLSLGDLAFLELRVEIKHKSNWHNEPLRQYRRSKFMCAFLSCMRKVGIDGPGGGGPGAGTINNPNYSVAITDELAKATRAKYDEEQDTKKNDKVQSLPEVATVTSSGLEILPSLSRGFVVADDGGLVRRKPENVRPTL